mgnify:CR=1 FL=1
MTRFRGCRNCNPIKFDSADWDPTPGRWAWNKAHLYRLLNNRKYLGEIEHKGAFFPGEQEAIVPKPLWDWAHQILPGNYKVRGNRTRGKTPALLKGVIKGGHCGGAMGPTFTTKKGKVYRYYLCVAASKKGYKECPVRSVSAGVIETAVVDQLRAVFRSPEMIARTFREAKSRESGEVERLRQERVELQNRLKALKKKAVQLMDGGGAAQTYVLNATGTEIDEVQHRLDALAKDMRALETENLSEGDVIVALEKVDPIWDELFPGEQARIVRLLVEGVEVHPDGLDVKLRSDGVTSLVTEINALNVESSGE